MTKILRDPIKVVAVIITIINPIIRDLTITTNVGQDLALSKTNALTTNILQNTTISLKNNSSFARTYC